MNSYQKTLQLFIDSVMIFVMNSLKKVCPGPQFSQDSCTPSDEFVLNCGCNGILIDE